MYDRFCLNAYSSIYKGELTNMLESLPAEVWDNIDYVWCQAIVDDDLYGVYAAHDFNLTVTDGKLTICKSESGAVSNMFTDEQYINGEKVAVIGERFYDKNLTMGFGMDPIDSTRVDDPLDKDTEYIHVNGEAYKIIKVTSNEAFDTMYFIPFTSLADDTPLINGVDIVFKDSISYSNYQKIKDAVDEYMAGNAYVQNMNLSAATDIAYYKTIIWITVAVAFLFAINLAVLYKYIVECNKRRIVIMRICGCKRSRSIRLFLTQALMIIAPVFALLEYAFHKLIYPNILDFFPNMINSFSLSVYAVMFVGYVVVSGAVLYAMLRRNIGKKLNFTEAAI
jgi:hypothetical protein